MDAIEVTMHSYIMTDGEPLAVWLHIYLWGNDLAKEGIAIVALQL